jgi:hypothetical protein
MYKMTCIVVTSYGGTLVAYMMLGTSKWSQIEMIRNNNANNNNSDRSNNEIRIHGK